VSYIGDTASILDGKLVVTNPNFLRLTRDIDSRISTAIKPDYCELYRTRRGLANWLTDQTKSTEYRPRCTTNSRSAY
jgi:hypothetical protein